MKKIQYISIAFVALLATGCAESYLTQYPSGSSITEEQYRKMDDAVEGTIKGIYPLLYQAGDQDWFSQRSIDLYGDILCGDMGMSKAQYGWFQTDELMQTYGRRGTIWSYYYNFVRACNKGINAVETANPPLEFDRKDLSDDQYKAGFYYAQLLTLRGWAYSKLSNFFVEPDAQETDLAIPIYTEDATREDTVKGAPRATVGDLYMRINDDLLTAINYFEAYMNTTYGDSMISGTISCPDSNLAMPQAKVLAKGLNWDFPFDYSLAEVGQGDADNAKSAPAAPRTGRISLGELEYDGIRAASLDGTVQWDDPAKTFRLKTDANLFSISGEIRADVALGAAGVEVECGMTIPDQDADLSKDLAQFLPQFEEISCTGKLGGSAVYRILPKNTTGSAEFHIADADVLIPEKKLEARGVSLGFEVPEIAALKSAPGQTLSFRSVKYDKIETGAGRATFRMEAPDTWQIENALLDWCGGHIRLGSVTYRPGQTTTEAVLYCDRLELPLFLTQIGLGQISGSGSINGTIPIVLVQKTDAFGKTKIDNVYFEDAFLFSTPGENGVIKGELDESLTNAESSIEMELSKDALKDFTYSWVRMRMISSGPEKENLKLELQLDGRPNRSLYYSFDEKTASFIKSPTPCIFQGIRLNTNVNMYGKAMELVDYFQQITSKLK